MYCFKCGEGAQNAEAYCRRCGTFMPDPDKVVKRETPPEQHLKANIVLSMMTILVSFVLAGLLYTFFFGRDNTHPVIYLTAGFLSAIGFWNIQTFVRNLKLRKQIVESKRNSQFLTANSIEAGELGEPAYSPFVPASVTDRTTNRLYKTQDDWSSKS
jgi:hypothetical protein